MTEEYFQEEFARLKAEHAAITVDAERHKDDIKYFMSRIDEAIAVANKMQKLNTEYGEFLLDQLEKGGALVCSKSL